MRKKQTGICSDPTCERPAKCRGLCNIHYQRALRRGLSIEIPLIGDFWNAVDKSGGPDACWPWTRGDDPFGYGIYRDPETKKNTVAHRYAWEKTNGAIPSGLCVLHGCDNPPCCNSSHHFLGTKGQNTDDMLRKKRNAYGEKCAQAKLTETEVISIRAEHSVGTGIRALGRKYGVNHATIWEIVHEKIWKHLL